jgi:hypothetical protein
MRGTLIFGQRLGQRRLEQETAAVLTHRTGVEEAR